MIYIKELDKINDAKYKVGYIHYMPFDSVNGLKKTESELLAEGKLVDDIKSVYKEGYSTEIYYNPIENKLFVEYKPISKTNEETEMDKLKTQLELQNQAIAELTMLIAKQ